MDKNRRYDLICLGTPQPGLNDGFEGLGGIAIWGMGWDAVPQTYCRWEEVAPFEVPASITLSLSFVLTVLFQTLHELMPRN